MNRIILLTFIFSLIISDRGSPAEISVKTAEGIEKINGYTENNVVYFSMSQLVRILEERLSWNEIAVSVSYKTEKHECLFFINSPYIRINDSIINMTYAAKLRGGQLYLPAQTFLPMLDIICAEHISWDQSRMTIRIDSEWYNITDIAFSSKTNGLLIEIYVAERKNYEIFTSEGNWLNVMIPDGIVNRRLILARKSNECLEDLNVFQSEKSAQISFRLKQGIGKYTHRYQSDPERIQISIIDTLAASLIKAGSGKTGLSKSIRKIIIDPGHGGSDYGAIGPKQSEEKEITLDIARRLTRLIRNDKSFEVSMTREEDGYVSLDQRVNIANKSKGDIFVSVHANASLKSSVRGFQVFFLAPAKNDLARAAAQLENAPFLVENSPSIAKEKDNLGYIISDMIQTEFQTESADLAAMIDREFRKNLTETIPRGIDQAGFFVLNGAYMPSILVETAFITNRADEKLLNSKKYRQAIAESIYKGLKRFKEKYESR
ncbi:MAG: N-acetylmuramoyl-L-alanine amidase [candidate division Zixibacteria bacterium]|nr:N-acetylmuramoyl-L-alanine amidase [candidate division Zixibacteria bacterium]